MIPRVTLALYISIFSQNITNEGLFLVMLIVVELRVHFWNVVGVVVGCGICKIVFDDVFVERVKEVGHGVSFAEGLEWKVSCFLGVVARNLSYYALRFLYTAKNDKEGKNPGYFGHWYLIYYLIKG